jgi:hypothetical protein
MDPLRRVLDANAVFSATSGLFFLVAAKPLGAFLGVNPLGITLLTLVMFGYAALLTLKTSRPTLRRSFVLLTVLGDSAWVLASILLLIGTWPLTSMEVKLAIGLTAICVDVFATLQFFEWRKMK